MNITKIPVGLLQANCYILNSNNKNIIIDPGDEPNKIIDNLNGTIEAILITHRHDDHIGAIDYLVKKYNCPVYEYKNLEEKEYKIQNFVFEVIFNPGHTYDSISFYFKNENKLFTGDFLFKESIGRTDLDTGNKYDMISSLKKILKYEDCDIYPGHGDITNLNYEKQNNLFIVNLDVNIL